MSSNEPVNIGCEVIYQNNVSFSYETFDISLHNKPLVCNFRVCICVQVIFMLGLAID